jgi:hypothetical protein
MSQKMGSHLGIKLTKFWLYLRVRMNPECLEERSTTISSHVQGLRLNSAFHHQMCMVAKAIPTSNTSHTHCTFPLPHHIAPVLQNNEHYDCWGFPWEDPIDTKTTATSLTYTRLCSAQSMVWKPEKTIP